MIEREWSAQQHAIFSWFETGGGNLVVRARAGTGKSTTLIEAVKRAPESSILLAAFNKRISRELQNRVTETGGRADVKTLHGVGFSIILRHWERCRVDQNRGFELARRACGDQSPDEMIKKVQKLAGLGKGTLTKFEDSESALDLLERMAVRFDLEPDDQWQQDGWTTDRIVKLAYLAMDYAREREPGNAPPKIDFDDMLFLPLANNWATPRYELVAVDEAQDMSPAQLELAQRVRVDSGRTAVIGDDRQAIYGFRGADSTAIDRLKAELKAAELGLTCTYRCGKSIVRYAKTMVPDFEAAETNAEGRIEELHESQLVSTAVPGDFILSRKNAPLVAFCLKLLRAGKPARIEGKDVAAGLKSIVKKWKPTTMTKLLENIDRWKEREIAKLEKKNTQEASDRIEETKDKAEILLALCDGLTNQAELLTRLDTMFGDSEEDRRPAVVCSSIHKAKGLEADRVFVLKGTLYPQRRSIMKRGGFTEAQAMAEAMKNKEECNLEYVAVTRVRNVLVWVS